MANQTDIKGVHVKTGDVVKVSVKVAEGEKERTQIFEGMVLAIRGSGVNKTFTVRKIAAGGIGVERIWPLISPWITKIEVKKTGKVRRAKLNYVRAQSVRQVSQITSGSHFAAGTSSKR